EEAIGDWAAIGGLGANDDGVIEGGAHLAHLATAAYQTQALARLLLACDADLVGGAFVAGGVGGHGGENVDPGGEGEIVGEEGAVVDDGDDRARTPRNDDVAVCVGRGAGDEV